jgi:hypothetical protein
VRELVKVPPRRWHPHPGQHQPAQEGKAFAWSGPTVLWRPGVALPHRRQDRRRTAMDSLRAARTAKEAGLGTLEKILDAL